MTISKEDYLKECSKHYNKRGGCTQCKYYEQKWATSDNLDTWCKVNNSLAQELYEKWENELHDRLRKSKDKINNDNYCKS